MDKFSFDCVQFLLFPLMIFFARIIDVTIGTLRIMFTARGKKRIAPILGFFEVLIWITALGNIMQNLNNPLSYIAYASGFATGTFVGIKIEERIAAGKILLRIITRSYASNLIESFSANNFGITHIKAEGVRGPVSVIYSFIERKRLAKAVELIKFHNPKAFYTIEDVRTTNEGVFKKKQNGISNFQDFLKRK